MSESDLLDNIQMVPRFRPRFLVSGTRLLPIVIGCSVAAARRGIRKNLEAAFNFRGLESVVTRDQLGEALASVQQHASSFFPVSWSTYQASSEPVMLVCLPGKGEEARYG